MGLNFPVHLIVYVQNEEHAVCYRGPIEMEVFNAVGGNIPM